jgi:HemY protein
VKTWIGILVLLGLAVAAAWGWHWLAADPGYVQLRLRGTTIETSLAFALVCLLLVWALVSLLLGLVRWPRKAWQRSLTRRGRDRLASGLTALAEGRYADAEGDLARAARHAPLRAPALLAKAHAAHARGATDRAEETLLAAGENAAPAALASRARFLIDDGRATEALALLEPAAARNALAPLGWGMLVEAALVRGDTETAARALAPLAQSRLLGPERQAVLEHRVLAATLAGANDADALEERWQALGRAQRRAPHVAEAYARRALALGQTRRAIEAIESAQHRQYSDDLARVYGELGPSDLAARTHTAEGWLERHPNSTALLTTLGRLNRDQSLWLTARQYLRRSLAVAETPAAWEALGDCWRGSGEDALAAACYANALKIARGDASVPLPTHAGDATLDTQALVFEERDAHGVPRLTGSGAPDSGR